MNRLCCRLCSENLRNPASIPCGHNFCVRCIQVHWNHDERNNSPCSCPECGQTFPSRPQLIKNITPADLTRDTERCDANSENRKRQHSQESKQAVKRPRSWTETANALCWRHSSLLDVYCCTDEQIICAVCASAEHMGHTIGSVRGERKRKQEELKNVQMKSKQILQKQEKKWKNLEKTLEQIQEEARNTEDYCESVLVSVIDSLQRHYLSVRELIRAQMEAAEAQVQISLHTLQVKMKEMKKWNSELECLAQSDNDIHFLQKWPSLRCEKDHLHPLNKASEDPLLPFELTKRAVEELGRQLEEFCDKEFASISQTADSRETEEDDIQQRCEASASQSHDACGLSLDPPELTDLAISVGDKESHHRPRTTVCQSLQARQDGGTVNLTLHKKGVLCVRGGHQCGRGTMICHANSRTRGCGGSRCNKSMH